MRAVVHLRLLAAAGLVSGLLPAQEPAHQTPGAKEWEFSASLTGYAVPHTQFFVNPTITADHSWLHLEARYNYENLKTGSVWTGYNFSFGDKLKLDLTPMIGGVVGRTAGVAPGYEGTLTFRKLELSTQGEYVIDATDRSASFFYDWSELSYSPVEGLRAGMVVQRTKVYGTSFEVQRGFLVGLSHKRVDFTAYVFNIGWTEPTCVFSLGVHF